MRTVQLPPVGKAISLRSPDHPDDVYNALRVRCTAPGEYVIGYGGERFIDWNEACPLGAEDVRGVIQYHLHHTVLRRTVAVLE